MAAESHVAGIAFIFKTVDTVVKLDPRSIFLQYSTKKCCSFEFPQQCSLARNIMGSEHHM